jgi:hypothetical protein
MLKERRVHDLTAPQHMMQRPPRSIVPKAVDDAAILPMDFRCAEDMRAVLERARIGQMAVARDRRNKRRRRCVDGIDARDAAAHSFGMAVLLDEQPVAPVVAVGKRIGEIAKRWPRREPADCTE